MKTSKRTKRSRTTRSVDRGCVQRVVSRLRRRYMRVVKIGDKWNTYLQIDHQGFCVVEQTCYHRARWFAKNLAIALERMLAANARTERPAHSGAQQPEIL